MANGYDTHSLKATGLTEASSSSMPLIAVRDKRFTRNGIGFRSQEATEATPPPIAFSGDYPGGTAARRRGQVDESKLPWETAQEATAPQIKPREALPPWLRDKEDEEEREAARMTEAPLNADKRNKLPDSAFALPGRKYPIDTPERARSALSRVEQFGSDEEKRKVRAAVKKKFPNMDVE